MFARFVACKEGEEHPPRNMVFGELVGGKGYSGGQDHDWMVRLTEEITNLA